MWPEGLRSAGLACGIKSGGAPDLGLLVFEGPVTWAGTFTQNAAAAPSVLWSRARLGTPVRSLVVNSGNANAATGAEGATAVRTSADAVASLLGGPPEEVLVASTGPIGVRLPVDKITDSIAPAMEQLDSDTHPFAEAIMTTDTVTKVEMERAGDAVVVGVAKGAAMLAPNMATMLAFIATDAAVDEPTLQKILDGAVSRSFNRISIDACESTNDSVFLFATGAKSADGAAVAEATESVCRRLALAMIRDAEGGSKVLKIVVEGASDEESACDLARGIASSAIWRAAVHGSDPNWGRVLAALGSVDRSLDLEALEVAIGGVVVFKGGAPAAPASDALEAMQADEVVLRCSVGGGAGTAEFFTCDLSPEYVSLNAEGTT